jgi:hypothetical protein
MNPRFVQNLLFRNILPRIAGLQNKTPAETGAEAARVGLPLTSFPWDLLAL